MDELLRELRTAVIWAAFGLALLVATQPVWSYLLFGFNLTIGEILSMSCLGIST